MSRSVGVSACALLALTCGSVLPAQQSGTLRGTVTFAGAPRSLFIVVTGVQEVSGFHTIDFPVRNDSFSIGDVHVGPMQLCIQAAGYRSIVDTVLVSEGTSSKLSYSMVMDEPRRDPYPLCDLSLPTLYVESVDARVPLSSAAKTGAFSALLEYYQRSRYTAAGAVLQNAVEEPVDSVPTPYCPQLAMALGQEATRDTSYVTWLETLAPAQACMETDFRKCPQDGFTTFLMFSQVQRLHGDTLKIVAVERALDPATCRTEESFTGGSSRGFLLSQVAGTWRVIGYAPGYAESWSGVCGPSE